MWLKLDGHGSLQHQLYVGLRSAILDGTFAAGTRLPSSRALAQDLSVSRNTVLLALEQLVSEGYIAGRHGSGTYVAHELPRPCVHTSPPSAADAAEPGKTPRLSASARAAARLERVPSWELRREPRTIDFRYGDPAYQDLPLPTWARLYAREVRRAGASLLAYREPGGDLHLREAIAVYLARSRGVRCNPRQVIITCGSQQAVDLCLRVLVDPGDRVGIEDPHYLGFRGALTHARAELVPIPVDEHGMNVDKLRAQSKLRLLLVTPSHQFPTGALLPAWRRLALLEWAHRHASYVLEDDYDGEFRYAGHPLESLQGRDTRERVLYVGTFSKLLFPALRIGYLVVPESLVDPFLRMKAASDTGSPGFDQHVLARFITAGHFERHVRKTRARNAKRHAALLTAIDEHLGSRVRASREPAGLHVWLEIPGLAAERSNALIAHARAEGVGLHSGKLCFLRPPTHATFIVGYASLDERRIQRGIAGLARALTKLRP